MRDSLLPMVFANSSPSSKGGLSSEGYSPLKEDPEEEEEEEEKILPASLWGSSLQMVTPQKDSSFPPRRRMRLPTRFRLLNSPSSSSSEVKKSPQLAPISKSSFYSLSKSQEGGKRRGEASPHSLRAPQAKRMKLAPRSLSRRSLKNDGINKGVSHGIKKPNKKKKASLLRLKEMKKKRRMREEKTRNQPIIHCETPKRKSSVKENRTPSSLMPPSRTGCLTMSSEQSKVSYEIVGGQMIFRRQQREGVSLSKQEPKKSSSTRLFSPSRNFLQEAPSSEEEPKRLPLSPVKFSLLEEKESPSAGVCLTDIIKNINSQCDGIQGKEEEEGSSEEIQKIAIETEEEIRSLLTQEEKFFIEVPVMEEKKVFFSDKHDRGDMMKNIFKIISNIPKPCMTTEEEEDPASSIVIPGSSEEGYFPIFSKDTALTGLKSPSQGGVTLSNRKALKDKDGLTQMVIDAGQKSLGAQLCLTCSTVYTVGDPEDEENHRSIHAGLLDTISFNGWQKERVVRYLPEVGRRILMVDLQTKETRHWERSKVETILSVVDNAIGSQTSLQKLSSPSAFLYIADRMVVGLLLAEKAKEAYPSSADGATLNLEEPVPVLAGISRLWVMPEYQRQGIASKLTDAFRENYFGSFGAHFIKMNEFAFSQTTPDGTAFASKYTRRENFLVYLPPLES